MSFEVIATNPFKRKAKKLSKKHKSLKKDLKPIFSSLSENPTQGDAIGKNCYKIRFSISSKGKGKSGGGRIITLVRFNNNKVFLLDIYDKSKKETITDKELEILIQLLEDS